MFFALAAYKYIRGWKDSSTFFYDKWKIKMSHYVLTAVEFICMPSLFEFFRDMKRKAQHASAVRTTINELGKLSDRELNDIGLSRGDIYWVAHAAYDKNENLRGWV